MVAPPLAERRDAAAVVAVGEAAGPARDAEGGVRQEFTVRSVIKAAGAPRAETVTARVAGPVTGTALLFGDEAGRFEAVATDETLLGYVAQAPRAEAAAAGRLGAGGVFMA